MAEPVQPKPPDSVGHRIVHAMFVIIFFQLFWKFGGLIVTVLVGSIFASGPEADAYNFVTKTVVFLLQTFCLKVFIPLLVPIFKDQLAEHGEEGAWRFANTVLNLTIVALAATVAAGFIFAPQVLSLFAPGFNQQQLALCTRLMRWMLPGVFGVCLATVTYGILNSYNVFGYAAAGDGVQKIVWAAALFGASLTGLALPRMLDVLAVGFVISAGAMLLTHIVGLRKKLSFYRPTLPGLSARRIAIEAAVLAAHLAALGAGLLVCEKLRPRLPNAGSLLALQQVVLVGVVAAYLLLLWWRARGRKTAMARFATLAVPLFFGILFAKYRDLVTSAFASFTGTGVFSDLEYARKVGEAPNTLVIAALSIALLPHLSELAAAKLWADFSNVMTKTIRIIVAFFVPLAALMVVLRQPTIALLFDRGNWTDYHLKSAGDALGLYILALPFFAIENPIQQSFFAMQRMWAPTIIGFLGTGFHILFLFIGIEWLGYGYFIVVAVVYCAARAFKNIILLLVMRMHVRILPWRPTLIFLAKAAIATAGVWAAAEFTYRPLKRFLPLDPYRRREVMIDTFNVELRDWEADNVDDFRIVSAEKDELVLQEAFGGVLEAVTLPVDGENALMARYRRSPRRYAGLRRDLSMLMPDVWRTIAFDVTTNEATDLLLQVVTKERQDLPGLTRHIPAGVRERIAFELRDLGVPERCPGLVALWIHDITPVKKVSARPTALVIDNLLTDTVYPGQMPIDDFEPTTKAWELHQSPTHGNPAVEDTGERPDGSELALHVRAEERPMAIVRSLEHDISGCRTLSFKARSDRPCTLAVTVTQRLGTSLRHPKGATIAIQPGTKRKAYSVPARACQDMAVEHFEKADGLFVEIPQGADVWLDNVAFVREAKGPRLGRVALFYELAKLIHVAVPTLAAFIVFIVLLFALRVEEAREAWEWLREKGIKKIVGRFRKRKPAR